jgi:hypothetical protein
MTRVRVLIPQRTRVYLGCEGQSEQSYGRLLSQVAEDAGLHLLLDTDPLCGGDPLAIVQTAIRHINQRKKLRGDFAHRALLLDRDRIGLTPERDREIAAIAEENSVLLIWQNPCHEGFLLRHFEGQATARPPTSDLAIRELRRIWPEYCKGMPASQLAARIEIRAIHRARAVEEQFSRLLDAIEFPRF